MDTVTITGVFEIHLIVRPEDIAPLYSFINEHKHDRKYINMRPTCAQTFYGDYKCQPMLTMFFAGTDKSSVAEAQNLLLQMEAKKMKVMRVKVESMANNPGVPVSCSGKHYYEFHFKIFNKHKKETTEKTWKTIEQACVKHGVHLFFNPFTARQEQMVPVGTLRKYNTTYKQATIDLDKLFVDLGTNVELESLEYEYSVLDSNVHLDKGWMFEKEPHVISFSIPSY
jgi:hypothetical protein